VFRPAKLTIPVGTTLTFRTLGATEPHNIAFGPKPYLNAKLKAENQFPEAGPIPNQVPGFFAYGSEDPALGTDGPFPYTGAAHHGNGFMSLPIKDNSSLTPALTSSAQITFTTPGTYVAYCLVHFPDMLSTITVTP
jgi:plastocyanin